jgi:hypothetical protein
MQSNDDQFAITLENNSIQFVVELCGSNGLTHEEFRLGEVSKTSRTLSFLMEIRPEALLSSSQQNGQYQYSGAIASADEKTARKLLEASKTNILKKLSTELYFESRVKTDKSYNFSTISARSRIAVNPIKYQWQEMCKGCRGTGKVACPTRGTYFFANRHITQCYSCNGSGKRRCSCNNGTETKSVYTTFPDRSVGWTNQIVRCKQCNGTRISGICYGCQGSGNVDCSTCAGSGRVGCNTCAGHGLHTHCIEYCFDKIVSKKMAVPVDKGQDFKTLIWKEKPTSMFFLSRVDQPQFKTVDGVCHITYPAMIDHIRFRVTIREKTFTFNGIGAGQVLVDVSPFLDYILTPFILESGHSISKKHFEKVIRSSRKFAVTNELLQLLLRNAFKKPEFLDQYRGTVSGEFVDRAVELLKESYHGLGRGPVKRVWLYGTFFISVVSFFPIFTGLERFLSRPLVSRLLQESPGDERTLTFLAIFTLPGIVVATATFFVASRLGHRSAARVTEVQGSTLSVKQGIYPLVGLVVSLFFVLVGGAGRLIVDHKLPGELIPAQHENDLLSFLGSTTGTRISPFKKVSALSQIEGSEALVGGPAFLPPSNLPPWKPIGMPAFSDIRGNYAIYQVQYLLKELGLRRSAPDGIGSTENQREVNLFLQHLPPYDWTAAGSAGLPGLLTLVVNDKLHVFDRPGPLFSAPNVIRFNNDNANIEKIDGALREGTQKLGTVIDWQGVQPGAGGRVLVSRRLKLISRICYLADIEVRVDGHAYDTGPVRECLDGIHFIEVELH